MNVERIACPKCGGDEQQVVLTGQDYLWRIPGEFSVSECRTCGLWFQNPRPRSELLQDLYPIEYSPHQTPSFRPPGPAITGYLQRRMGYGHAVSGVAPSRRPAWFARRRVGVALVPRYVPDGRLLELGCATGARLLLLRHLGWRDLHGLEFVPQAAAVARAQGLMVECGPLEDMLPRYPADHFDTIVSSMVLEHLVNPFEVVRTIAKKLRLGGEFLFSTITRDSLDARLYGTYWAGFDFPRHMVYLRMQDIRDMLGEEFQLVEWFHQSAPIDYVRSSSWRAEFDRQRLLDRIVLGLGRSLAAHAVSMVLAWLEMTCRVSFRCRRTGPAG